MMRPARPEVLAPAGDRAALEAAVRGGADAVYFGLRGGAAGGGAAPVSPLNARARAGNFDVAELEETMRFLHAHGVKGYVTLNTLVFDDELPAVRAAVEACAAAGADAIIVQDLGVMRLARALAPGLPIHASTQMTCTDAASVELARSLGAARVILARELSLDDIAAIRRATDVELEVFVHGALCIAYSGQCLTSEAIGGRSANRGACAQACRLPYRLVVDGALRDLGDAAYLLSPEDLDATDVIPDLVALGVASVKIEGRLKGPEYVGATARLYRAAIDAAAGGAAAGAGAADREAALQAFSRGSGPGFLRGVDHQRLVDGRTCDHRGIEVGEARGAARRRGREVVVVRAVRPLARGEGILVEGGFAGEGEIGGRIWGLWSGGREVERAPAGGDVEVWLGPEKRLPDDVLRGARSISGRRVFRTSDPAAARVVRETLERAPRRVAIDVRLEGRLGERPRLSATAEGGVSAAVEVDAPLASADRSPLDEATLRKQLDRLGDTPFVLRGVALSLEDPARPALLPPSALNRARRALVAALLEASHWPHARAPLSDAELLAGAAPPAGDPPPSGLFVLCRNVAQARAALEAGARGVYLDFLEMVGLGAAARELKAAGAFVAVAPPRIRKPGEEKIDRYLRSLEPSAILVRSLGALLDVSPDIPRIGDFSLNVTNKLAASEVLSRGLAAFTPSFDLDSAQLVALLDSPFAPFAEVVVHHPMPLFHMEHCVIAATLSEGKDHLTCGRPCEQHVLSLRDRAGMDHPLEADVGCRNTVFHAAPQSAAHLVPRLAKGGVRRFRIELVREDAREARRVVEAYRRLLAGEVAPAEVARGLRTEGSYGVVRGSLRVLQA
ncbi:peptidase U32 [Sorangium cellulosum]|uniref:Peptidase U32 n=1 Tax=Sorangium cellulosum TaxID=56 RepID=A0A2L0EPH5_SORCE|nr:U32 family peptidase [Sorangium cellulosum]AUX41175.1 peptidase U32 [Sorangium cellulosum]